MKKSPKTKVAKSLFDYAVRDNKDLIYFKSSLNVSDINTASYMQDDYVTIHSSLKDINNVLLDAGKSEFEKIMALNAFRAKYSELYAIYAADIESEIENMCIVTNDLTQDLNGEENTPIKCIISYVQYGVKNGDNICTPIREENERYIKGIKSLKKECKNDHKNRIKNAAKTECKFSRLQWIENKTTELIAAGVPSDMAKNVAENLYNNLPTK